MSVPQNTLLIELLMEELPPKTLSCLAEAFAHGIVYHLRMRGFLDANGCSTITPFATPRRLAVSITKVSERVPDVAIRVKVLPVSVALDSKGNPSRSLVKKLTALGFPNLPVSSLERVMDGKDEAFFYTYITPGDTLHDALQAVLDDTLSKLPISKMMNYQRPDGETVQFVRPVHGLIALHGNCVVPVTALGLTSSNRTQGHRFLSSGEVIIAHADDYADTLLTEGKIIANFMCRRELIRTQLLEVADNDCVVMPDTLLEEVTALVEFPAVYVCNFEPEFLTLPQECLILTMQMNQKYFALTDKPLIDGGRLINRFLIVSNLMTDASEQIVMGNERVVRSRLADAKFFFEQDKKKSLAARVPLLGNVIYHNKLGSQQQRSQRLEALAGEIAVLMSIDKVLAKRAALLAKADLLTDMVGEFPELQGTMGMYYARHDGEVDEVALACFEHYQPRFAGDTLPTSAIGIAVALADKLEILVGIWGIGLQPTGEKDPFALRRHAFGIIRILIEKRLSLKLDVLLKMTYTQFTSGVASIDYLKDVMLFIYERLRGYLRERGYGVNEIEAVLAVGPQDLSELPARLDALCTFVAMPEAAALIATNKRIGNILKKNPLFTHDTIDPLCLVEVAERSLAVELENVTLIVDTKYRAGAYSEALLALVQLRGVVDAFFNDVMVMVEDETLRNNRLKLLSGVYLQMNRVANLSKLFI
ncbi:glycine--tRNA ligase subunit beta [Candidatus Pandoraea novymonadis]|uniref:Glycine--tRNA ligase beta subunit n=1 Tax=Candidatus Pandoraea novymonadis TaxID=1808959 RepID=A0ABX5FD58_9BURK|nr:glycine--tRNA ligase subunit beta [Candidatus Pandoraea novymonadis]PSB91716.1 Glycine-tRNA ligase beta subunit [Candidatus Pandoraea novymonadis]